jgi:hypothetical protein
MSVINRRTQEKENPFWRVAFIPALSRLNILAITVST